MLALMVADDEEEAAVKGRVGDARQRLRSLLHVRVQILTGRSSGNIRTLCSRSVIQQCALVHGYRKIVSSSVRNRTIIGREGVSIGILSSRPFELLMRNRRHDPQGKA